MKTIKLLLSATLLTVATSASAQFANSGSSGGGGFSLGTVKTDDYSRFKVSYLTQSFSFDTSYSYDSESLKGVSIEYLYGKHITQNLPLFIEYGTNFSWGFSKETYDHDDVEVKLNVMSLTVPINLAYKFSVNDDFSIDPHIGIGARVNLLANESYDDGYYDESYSYFDKDDVGKDNTWNRFQLCGQAGVGLCFQQFYFGYEYSWNFMELAEKTKLNTNYISVGINF